MVVISIALIVFPAVYYRYVGSDYLYPQMLTHLDPDDPGSALFLARRPVTGYVHGDFRGHRTFLASVIGAAMSMSLLLALWFVLPIAARRAARRRGPNTNASAPVPASFKE